MAAFFSIDPGIFFSDYPCNEQTIGSQISVKELMMETKLYVGNLSYDTTEEGLRTAFAKAGSVVSIDMIRDRDTGQLKGFAFVTMNNQEEAQNAIKILNEKMLDDRALRVNLARPREERPQRSSYDRRR
jgi:RNA recognition motif-containing protein